MFQRFLTYIAGILVFAIAGLFVAPAVLDMSKFKNEFSASIKEITGVEPVIEGEASVAFLPFPKITLGYINIPNVEGTQSQSILSADGVEAKFTFTSLLKGKFEPSSITLLRPHFEIEKTDSGEQNFIAMFKNKGDSATSVNVHLPHNIAINNGTIIYRSGTTKTSVDYISANITMSSPQGPFDFKGSFQQGSATLNFTGKIGSLKDDSESTFDVISDTFTFSMKGKHKAGDDFNISGSAELSVKDLSKFTDAFFNESLLLSHIESSESLAAKSDFQISKTLTSFNKLNITSDSIKGNGNVDIFYNNSSDDTLQWDVTLNMDNIDSDKLHKAKEKIAKSPEEEATDIANMANSTNLSSYHFDLPKEFSSIIKFSLKEFVYNGDKVKNLLIDTEIFNGRAIVHSISAELPGNSKIEFSGNVDNNGIRPLFLGKIKAYGDKLRSVATWLYPQYSFVPETELNEFLFSCDLNVTPKIVNITNIYGSADRTLINGSILLHPLDTTPSINADLKLDRLNFDKYNATQQINDFLGDFISNAKDSNLDTSWIKVMNYRTSLSLSGDDMVYNGNNIKNFSASIASAKGLLSVQNINIDSDIVKLHGKIGMNFIKETPELSIDLASEYFDSSAFILKNPPAKTDVAIAQPKSISIWSKDPINLMGINRFNGTLSLSVDAFKHDTISLNNVSLKGELKKDVFTITEAKANFGEKGKISIKGSAGVSKEAPSIGISILASDVELQDILHAAKSTNTSKGTLYIGGIMKTFGVTFYDWINELKATAKIASRNVEIKGLDLPEIIEQSRKLYSVIDMNNVIKTATQTGTTKFLTMDGNIVADKSILQAKDFNLSTDKSRGAFAGNISLHNLAMKGLAKIDYIPEFSKKVTLSFNLDGTIPDTIIYKLDSSNLEQYITGKASR